MKIIINKGTSVDNAIKSLSEFLKENYSEYPIIKNTMNVYITLKNIDGQICPDNEKEYILRESGKVKDVFDEEKIVEFNNHLSFWNKFVNSKKREKQKLESQIEKDVAYLTSAKEKNKKEDNIKKRVKQYDTNKFALKKINELIDKICFLDEIIKGRRFITYYIKQTKRSSYNYKLDVIFIFKDINGYNGYFDWNGLHDGFPPYILN